MWKPTGSKQGGGEEGGVSNAAQCDLLRRTSAACPKFDMVLAESLAYPSGEEGGNFFVQMIFTCLPSHRERGMGRQPVAAFGSLGIS